MEYKYIDGTLRQGYFCMRCGQSCNMHATGHGEGKCEPNHELVNKLVEVNTP